MTNPEDLPPLPKGWIRTYSNSQRRYYYSHKDTKHTQWHFPTASEASDPWMAKRRAEENQQRERKKRPVAESSSGGGGTSGGDATAANGNSSNNNKKQKTTDGAGTSTTTATAPKNNNNTNDNIDALLALADTTNIAIIVPYRDLHSEQKRAAHLAQFVPHMIQFLTALQQRTTSKKSISDFHVYIVEQSDDGRKFNRGKLLNIGFDYAKKQRHAHHDVFIFHDVDLLPQPGLSDAYATFPKTPYHIARVWDRYSNNPKYFGGVVSFSSSDFKRINGYPNTFWGWGGEDDELQLRCQNIGLKWDWPRGVSNNNGNGSNNNGSLMIDLEDMNLTEKLNFLRQHKEWKCMVKWEALEEHETTWKKNGLADLQYKVLGTTNLDPKTNKATKVTVDVKLNKDHWANDKCGVDFKGDWNKKK